LDYEVIGEVSGERKGESFHVERIEMRWQASNCCSNTTGVRMLSDDTKNWGNKRE
jgi:hypothetical protein